MVTRRPRSGETLDYMDGRSFKVASVEGNLCWIHEPDGKCDPFIWRFRDGLNSCFSEAEPR